MKTASLLAAMFALALFAGVTFATDYTTDTTLSTNTTWSGTINIGAEVSLGGNINLTIQPGTIINFTASNGSLHLTSGGALSAQGTAAQPITVNGGHYLGYTGYGQIFGAPNKNVSFDHCNFSNMGTAITSGTPWYNVNPTQGLSMSNCAVTNSSSFLGGGGTGETISGCSFTNVGYIKLNNSVSATVTGSKISSAGLIQLVSPTVMASYNAIVNSGIYCYQAGSNITIHDNYMDNTMADGSSTHATNYCLEFVNGQVYNNFFHGASWTVGYCTGHFYNNVMEALTPAEKTARGDGTHEIINNPGDNTNIEHNIIVNNAMGSFMTATGELGVSGYDNNGIIRNNTFDQRCTTSDTASAVIAPNNHGAAASQINVRNNLFLRGGRYYDISGKTNSIGYTDYNCWAGRDTNDSESGMSTDPRFVKIYISGKTAGDDGFGMHDVLLPTAQQGYNVATLVKNPNITCPYTDAQMLAGTHTTAEILAAYWDAYTPVAGSSIIDAGSPADSTDPAKLGARIDIGAVEAPLPVATYLPGDFNKDHIVDYHDYLILEGSFGKSGMTWADGDANNDSLVDYHDYLVLEQNFGKTAPEPVTLSLLAVGAVALLRRRA